MKKSIKVVVAILFLILFQINTNNAVVATVQAGTGLKSTEQNSYAIHTECLYPEHLRRDIFFSGKLTEENITYLMKISHTEALSGLDVLRGNNGDLMLDKNAERVEGAAMLVRLLGVEEYALTKSPYHPFTDVPDWANPYVGYLYQNGLTKGIGNNQYGSHHFIDEKSYITFLLRALGYSDSNGRDFTWDTVGEFAVKTGLLEPNEEARISRLLKRERLSQLSWRAMFLNHKQQNKPLLICLYEQGMINFDNLASLFEKSKSRLIDQWFAFLPTLEKEFTDHSEIIELTLSREQADKDLLYKYLEHMIERVQLSTGVFLQGYSTELWQYGSNYTLFLYPDYANTASGDEKLRQWVNEIISEIISADMTDYEKVKAAHDYLVTHLEYDSRPSSLIAASSFSALGALETGVAVCKAYSELMALILNRVGVPCRIVLGQANGTEHAWNMVCIDGELYHVDTTWDDPVTNRKGNVIRYDYFNLSDKEIEVDHNWDRSNYPACNSSSQNYFVKNNLVIENAEALKTAITDLLENRKTDLMIKYIGNNSESIDIHKIINDINSDAGYVISSYVYSFNEPVGVICLELIEYVE